jgi:hypothetical protein
VEMRGLPGPSGCGARDPITALAKPQVTQEGHRATQGPIWGTE